MIVFASCIWAFLILIHYIFLIRIYDSCAKLSQSFDIKYLFFPYSQYYSLFELHFIFLVGPLTSANQAKLESLKKEFASSYADISTWYDMSSPEAAREAAKKEHAPSLYRSTCPSCTALGVVINAHNITSTRYDYKY